MKPKFRMNISKTKLGPILVIIIILISVSLIINNRDCKFNIASAGSSWEKTTDKDFSNGTLINLTIVGMGNNAELSLELSNVPGWTEKRPQVSPSPRRNHAIAAIHGTNKVLLFGGNTSTENNNETWLYDFDTNLWIQEFTTVTPAPRYYHAMASVDVDDKVVMFGGLGPEDNSTWIYDLSDHTWEKKTPTPRPTWRWCHTMATIHGDDKILLYDGQQDYYNRYYETWIYDVSENNWTEKALISYPDGFFVRAMAGVCYTDNVIEFGGNPGTGMPIKETWVYAAAANKWTKKTTADQPNVIQNHQMATIHGTDAVLLYGGRDYGGPNLDETWIYGSSDNTWAQENTKHSPNLPNGHAVCSIWGTDKVLLFGGNYVNNETWEYKYFLPETTGTFISKPFDTVIRAQFYNLDMNFTLPASTNIKLQLRSAANLSKLLNMSYVGPDGDPGTFYNSPSTPIWSGHNGHRFIQYRVFFDIFERSRSSPALHDVRISYNCLPETIVLDPVDGSLLTNNKPTFTWTFVDLDSEFQNEFQLIMDDDITFGSIDFDTGIRNSTETFWEFPNSTSYTVLPDGTWYWKVRTSDPDGAWTKYSSPRKLDIDTQAPGSSIDYPNDNGFYYTVENITGTVMESSNGSGLEKVEIIIKCINTNEYWNGSTWVPLKTWQRITGTENIEDLENFEKWKYESSSVPWSSGFDYYIQSRATDRANNTEVPSQGNALTIMIDQMAPSSKIESPVNGSWLNELRTISGNALDIHGSGVAAVEVSIKCSKILDNNNIDKAKNEAENDHWNGISWDIDKVWLPAYGFEQWSLNCSNISWSTGNQYTIQVRAYDSSGNTEEPHEGVTFYFDNQKPEPISISINNGDEYTTETGVALSLQATDLGSGVSDMSFGFDGINWTSWESFNYNRSFYLVAGEGNYTVYFRVRDHTGNIAEPVWDSIILDSKPPTELEISINDNEKYTNDRDVSLDLLGIDTLSGISNMSLSYDGTGMTWQPWESYQSMKTISLTTGDGEKKVYFKLQDRAGNTAEPVADSIILDTEPPHALSISINNDAKTTNSTIVSLQLKAIDETSGVDQISFSTDQDTWGGWENYSELKDFSLPLGDGLKTIHFKVKDRAGNIAEPMSASILLDTSTKLDEDNDPQWQPAEQFEFWPYLLLIMAIFILIVSGLIAIYVRNKRIERKLMFAGILPIKTMEPMKSSGVLEPVITGEQVTGPEIFAQLGTPKVAKALPILEKTTQTAASVSVTPAAANTTTTSSSESAPKPTPPSMAHQLPQLPPAKNAQISQDSQDFQTLVSQDKIGEVPPVKEHAPTPTLTPGPQNQPIPIPTPATVPQTQTQPQPQPKPVPTPTQTPTPTPTKNKNEPKPEPEHEHEHNQD